VVRVREADGDIDDGAQLQRRKRGLVGFDLFEDEVRGALTRFAAWNLRVGRRVVGPSR
jgi:hypothetical protein